MVTHNPDLECYADRVLYIKDGKLVKQAINEFQIPLKIERYLEYINKLQEWWFKPKNFKKYFNHK